VFKTIEYGLVKCDFSMPSAYLSGWFPGVGVILYPLSSLLLFDLQLPTIWHNNPSGRRGWDMYSLECPNCFFVMDAFIL